VRYPPLVLAVLGIMLSCHMAWGQSWLDQPAAPGPMVAEVGRASLHLPPGTWELLGEEGHGSGAYNASGAQKVYLQVDGGAIASVVFVSANTEVPSGHRAHWLVPSSCGVRNPDILFSDDRDIDNNNGRFDCLQVGVIDFAPRTGSVAWAALLKRASSLGGVPPWWLYALFAQSSRSAFDETTVLVLVNPRAPGLTAALARRPPPNASSAAARARVGEIMAEWARGYRATVAKALE
jgi:hypothetical protein